ncbi:MAG: putative lipoprotein [Proteobacteria bacterium]|nr:putative lipoprotein [Pseudomonadota bacterium]
MTQDDFLEVMGKSNTKVDELLEKGSQEEAVGVLGDLAKKSPDRKEPWVRIAKIYFDAGNYAQAIVASEEVLQRDATDRSAKSIRAVAGLRVATQSLGDLRNDVELKGNARSDAASLAKVMRETLGEDVLVPPSELEARKKREAAAAATHAKPRVKKKEIPAVVSAPPPAAASSGNPFGSLK